MSRVLLKTDGVKSHFLFFKHFVCFSQNRVISRVFDATSLQALYKSDFMSVVKRLLSPHISHIKILSLYSLFTLESILVRSCLLPFPFSQLNEYKIIDLCIVTCNKHILSPEVRKKCVANPSLQSKQDNPSS